MSVGQWCTALLLATLLAATSGAPPARAQGPERLKIVGNDRQFVIQTPQGPFTITRTLTACAPVKGFLQPLIPLPGVRPVAEIEVLQALNDPQTMVIDMRDDGEPLEATIPNSYNIPFNELEDRMDEMGCTRQNKQPWDCTKALQIVAFCNGPVCPQSPAGIASMVRAGFPVSKISYYRGGMMDWEALGLTTVSGHRPTKK
ncbi:MAG TPA: rhodanese-like domain-containing protein [Rhodoferax sp.]|jgi:rhodanese-related sulfurtransferase|nr:rhodanese-like domain-containing protein [Rhodoferax sp.]HNV58836.1 rhodanese-like domain-containing protein [Rhodoferax sp.]